MTIIGYILAVLIGLFLGLLGGGGSILSVPILRYIFDYSASEATAYSLFIVGAASIIGTANYIKDKQVDFRVLFSFGVVASVSAFLNRSFVVPSIPENIFTIGNTVVTRDLFIMILFASMMFLSAKSMIKKQDVSSLDKGSKMPLFVSLLIGAIVGFFTSLIGAGGGFIVVPILVKFYQMPIKRAIATSLSIIMINSLAGFSGQALTGAEIDWPFLVKFSGVASLGILAGIYLSNIIPSKSLKPIFGWFIVVMSVFIVIKEIMLL